MASHFFIIQSLFLFSQRSLSTQFCPNLPMISVEEPFFHRTFNSSLIVYADSLNMAIGNIPQKSGGMQELS